MKNGDRRSIAEKVLAAHPHGRAVRPVSLKLLCAITTRSYQLHKHFSSAPTIDFLGDLDAPEVRDELRLSFRRR
jgi:hypothetical protein